MLGWFADPRNSRPARRLEQTWAVAAVAAWLMVGDAGLVGWAQYPPGGWPPPGGGGGGVPPCNPSCTLEIVSPAEGDIVSGVVTIDSVLHITSGPPADCTAGITGLSLTFSKNPANWDPNDWWVLDWVAGAVVPVPRAFDSTQWCYLHPQVATRTAVCVQFQGPPCCEPAGNSLGAQDQVSFTIFNEDLCCDPASIDIGVPGEILAGQGCSGATCRSDSRPRLRLPAGLPLGFGGGAYSSDGLNPVLVDIQRDPTAADGPLGPGWNHNYNAQLAYFEDDDGVKHVTLGRGLKQNLGFQESYPGSDQFIPVGAGSAGNYSLTLNRDPGGQPVDWTLTTPEHGAEQYAPAAEQGGDGRLLSVADSNGNATTLAYDANGRLTSITSPANKATTLQWTAVNGEDRIASLTDAANRTWQLAYTLDGQLQSLTEPDGGSQSYAYDESGRITSYVDGTGHTWSLTYDAQGRVTQMTDPSTQSTTIAYEATDPMTGEWDVTVTDPNTNATTYHFSQWGELLSVIDALGGISAYALNGDHQPTDITDPLGSMIHYGYDQNGNVTSITQGDQTTTFTYDAQNRPLTETDPLNRVTQYAYDGNGNVLTVTKKDAQGQTLTTETFTYNAQGQRLTATDPRGNTTNYGYDQAGNLVSVTDPLGNATTYAYNPAGDRATVTDPLGNTTTYEYDTRHRVTKVTHPGGAFRTTTYNCCLKTAETDENGNQTQYQYDPNSRLAKVIDALGGQTQYVYDNNGNRVAVIDARGNATTYAYDDLSRASSITYADGATEQFEYDAAGRKTASIDQKSQRTEYQYDAFGRVTTIHYPANPAQDMTFTYDPLGNRLSMTDPTGTYTYGYDSLNRVASVTDPHGTVTYQYDSNGNRTRMDDHFGGTTLYQYNANDQVTQLTDRAGGVYGFQYDAAGRRTASTHPNGARALYGYDSRSQVTSVHNRRSDGAIVADLDYTRDAAGNPLTISETIRDVDNQTLHQATAAFTYDALDRLTGEHRTGWNPYRYEYDYDSTGNRQQMRQKDPTTGELQGTTNYTYNNMNQMLTAGNIAFTYDLNGNQTTKTVNNVTVTMTWDARNKMVGYTDGVTLQYQYDGEGTRVRKVNNGTQATENYVFDRNLGLPQVLFERPDAGEPTVAYVREPDGSLLAQIRNPQSQTPVASYYAFDALGSTRVLTGSQEQVTETYVYDAWGGEVAVQGDAATPFAHVGREGYARDAVSGMASLGARWYQSTCGVFVSRDPLGSESPHPYAYALGRPTVAVDPDGERVVIRGDARETVIINQALNWIRTNLAAIGACYPLQVACVQERIDRAHRRGVHITCQHRQGRCWAPGTGRVAMCGGMSGVRDVIMCRSSWEDPRCPSPHCTLLHEIMHTCGAMHGHMHCARCLPGCPPHLGAP
ncbi:MAG: hypothetical protein AUJ96_19760 [Armatimonadetes bacterium CG2_30_66_41]|nr:MAG: hypothetical protein AUJ96_19760 [Armatimonadetes bacterium CG2_30_66_41]